MANNLGNAFVKTIASSPLHSLLGPGIALITVHGRKTGRDITTPINVVAGRSGFTATSLRSRTLWRNLRGGAPAEVRVAGQVLRVCGEVIESDDAVRAGLARYFDEHPKLAPYFGVTLDAEHRPDRDSLERLARERVIVVLRPRPEA